MKKLKILLTALCFSLLASTAFTQETPHIISELPSEVLEAKPNYQELEEKYELSTWNYNNTLFAYVQYDTVVIIDTKQAKISNRIQLDAEISYLQFQNTKKADQSKLFVLSKNGEIFFVNCKNGKILWIGESYEDTSLTAAAFNLAGNALVTGYTDGRVVLFNQQGDSNFFVPTEITSLEQLDTTEIKFLNFSPDNKYILMGDSSSNLIIWDIEHQTEAGRFYYNQEYCKSAFFTGLDNNILMLIDTLTAGIFDFEGNLKQKVQLEYSVKKMSISGDGKTIMIVSNNNKRNYYNVNDKGSLEDITQSVIAANTAARYSQGITSGDAALTGNDPLPNISDAEYHRVIINEDTGAVQIDTLRPEGDDPNKYYIEHPDRSKNYDIVEAGGKIGIAPNPFTVNIFATGGYVTYRLVKPFYFGGKADFGIGIPGKNFPYVYEKGGKVISNPKLFTFRGYGVAGISFYPFDPDIEIFTDLSIGYTGTFLWNIKFGTDGNSSKLFSSLYTDVRVGASYKGFKTWIDCEYEPIFYVAVNVGFGYEIKLPSKKNSKTEN